MKAPLTNDQYAKAVEICNKVKRGSRYIHKKTGDVAAVVDVKTGCYYPSIGLRSTGLRPRYYTIRALNFANTYEPERAEEAESRPPAE